MIISTDVICKQPGQYIGWPTIAQAPNGDLLVSDASQPGSADRILLYPANGDPRRLIIDGLNITGPYQISTTLDNNFVVANNGLGAIRFFNDGAPSLLNVNLGPDEDGDPRRPFGIYPLLNGNFLVTGDRLTGISILDITDPNNGIVGNALVRGSSYEFIAPVCLPY